MAYVNGKKGGRSFGVVEVRDPTEFLGVETIGNSFEGVVVGTVGSVPTLVVVVVPTGLAICDRSRT